mmetsp:Transcript_28481/g.65817  ORF Transcript_28481/g.65817 Transcript_28481/m.65817 type:complete len:247 (+) Transcript_28481:81-821(+)
MPEHIIDDNFDVKIHGYVFCGQSVHTHLPKAAENYGITQEEWTVMSERLNKGLKANNCYRALCASVCGTRMSKDDIVDEINEEFLDSKNIRMVVHGSRGVLNFEHILPGERRAKKTKQVVTKWTNGLFSCCGNPGGVLLCLKGTLCPCIVIGDIGNYFMHDHKYTMCCASCCLELCLCHFKAIFMYDIPLRMQVMQRRDIQESMTKTCLTTCCCCCCSRIQMWNELSTLKAELAAAEDEAPAQQQM